jgi:hypothetical protein
VSTRIAASMRISRIIVPRMTTAARGGTGATAEVAGEEAGLRSGAGVT